MISAGVNYAAHVAEVSTAGVLPRPTYPVAFAKFPSIMVGHGEPIIHSRHTKQLDYELELAFVIGKRCKDVPVDQFQDVVFGYTGLQRYQHARHPVHGNEGRHSHHGKEPRYRRPEWSLPGNEG